MTSPTPARRSGLRPGRLLGLALLVLPILEILVIVAVGQAIGAWPTFLLLVAGCVLGVLIIRHQGGRAWRALNQAVQSGRMPARELADGIVVLLGGTLLLVPGFITDVLGLILVLPFTRPVARSLLASVISRRMIVVSDRFTGPTVADRAEWERQAPPPQGPRRSASSDEVVEGEIIDED
ncbi:hypothetical protein GCM10027053_39500 [Intrasporangium mesophilum]